jgi:hypothetical protein
VGYIYYQLNNGASLAGMAPPALAGGAFGVAVLPAGMAGVAGIYIIINCQAGAHNRYVGISTNIGNRFSTRMSVVTELGIPAAAMANIHAVWGTVKVRNDPLPVGTPTGLTQNNMPPPAQIPFPTWAAAGWTVAAPPPGGGPFTAMVDGNNINLEHLLIRFVMMRMGAGGTTSNNLMAGPVTHPVGAPGMGGIPLRVKFHSAAFGPYAAFTRADTLNPGFVW